MRQDGFRTSDTTLATYLITKQFFLLSIDYSQPRFEFCFSDSADVRQAASNYVTGNALAEPSAFARVNKKLLRIIHKQVQWEDD